MELLEQLSDLYGNPSDPAWGARVRPLLDEALTLSRTLGATDPVLVQALARLLLGDPALRALALRASEPLTLERFPLLRDPFRANVDTTPFSDPSRFLTPDVASRKGPLLVRLGVLLGQDPSELLPSPPCPPELSGRARFAVDLVAGRLKLLEPRAPLERLEVLIESDRAVMVRPHYTSSWLVFGGTHYVVGPDGGVLAVTPSADPGEVLAAYEDGVRSDDLDPSSSDEVWARNCGPTARAMSRTLKGHRTSPRGVLGHWEKGHFVDGELLGDMLLALDLKQPTTVDHAELTDIVKGMPARSQLVVGVKWKDWNRGHWFNILKEDGQTLWVNGQDGSSGSWPAPLLARVDPWALVLRPKH